MAARQFGRVLLQQEESQAEVPSLRRVDVAARTYHWFDDVSLSNTDASFPAQVFGAHATSMVCKLVSDNALFPMDIKPIADAICGRPENEDLFKAVIQMAEPNTEWGDCLNVPEKSHIAKRLLDVGFADVVSNTDYDKPYVPVSILNAMLDNAKFPAKDITMVANLWHRLTANVVSGDHRYGDYSAFLVRVILLSCGSDTERYERPQTTGGVSGASNPSDASVCFNLAALSFVGRRAEAFVLLAGSGSYTKIDVESVQSILHRCACGVLAMSVGRGRPASKAASWLRQRRCESSCPRCSLCSRKLANDWLCQHRSERRWREPSKDRFKTAGENPRHGAPFLPEFFNAILCECGALHRRRVSGTSTPAHATIHERQQVEPIIKAFIRKMVVESTPPVAVKCAAFTQMALKNSGKTVLHAFGFSPRCLESILRMARAIFSGSVLAEPVVGELASIENNADNRTSQRRWATTK